LNIATYRIDQLPADDFDAWINLCRTVDPFRNPFFHPWYALAATAVRPGVRVAVVRESDRPVGFFGFEIDRRNRGRPIGGRLSDFQGIVSDRQLPITTSDLLGGCDLKSFRYDHWLAPFDRSEETAAVTHNSAFIDLSDGFENYRRRRLAEGSTRLRKIGQLSRRLERQLGTVTFDADDRDPAAFDCLKRWKSNQYRRTGAHDIFRHPWVADLMNALLSPRSDHRLGRVMTYRAGGRLLAVHLGMQTDSVVHWWFPAYDPDLAPYSPGLLMLTTAAEQFAGQGCIRIDLGRGEEPFKRSLTGQAWNVSEGSFGSTGLGGWIRSTVRGARRRLRDLPGKKRFSRITAFVHRIANNYDFR
jgi:CelD/BcsL family acetyltransferase involved in cellulose biosynthesis